MKKIIILVLILISSQVFAQQYDIAKPGKNGIFIHLGLDIPNGISTDLYMVERKNDNGDWEILAKLKYPNSQQQFSEDFKKFSLLFPFVLKNINTQTLYENLQKVSSIQDTGTLKEINLLAVRLAARNVFYDQTADKFVYYQYRVTRIPIEGAQTQFVSEKIKYPGFTDFTDIKTTLISHENNNIYLKWNSKNGKNPYWVGLYHYENDKAILDTVEVTHFSVGDSIIYFTQVDDYRHQQYIIIPFDYYGNQGDASQVTYVEKIKSAVNYFQNLRAKENENLLQIDLSWDLNNNDEIKQIDIYRSEDYHAEFKKISTVSNVTNNFIDMDIEPDKIYYYRLSAILTFSNQVVNTVRFFGYGFEKQTPIPPQLQLLKSDEKSITLKVSSNEQFLSGVRIFRKRVGVEEKVILVSDLIPLEADTAIFSDTTKLIGGRYYEYLAKSENSSHFTSEFSSPIKVQALNKIRFNTITGFTNTIYNKKSVHLYWDNILDEQKQLLGYRIYKTKVNGEWEAILPKDSIFTLNRYVDNSIDNPGEYEYKVCPIDFMFREGKCTFTKVYIRGNEKIKGHGITLMSTSEGIKIQIQKIQDNDIVNYLIYRYQRGGKVKMIKELSIIEEGYMDKKVKKGQLYFYYVIAVTNKNLESLKGNEVGLRY